MAGKEKYRKTERGRRRGPRRSEFAEQRRAEAITVAWMLSMVTTLAAEVVGGVTQLLLALSWHQNGLPKALLAMPGLMLFTAVITGTLCLLLTPLTHRFRRVPPPPAITLFALIVSAVPLVVALLILIC